MPSFAQLAHIRLLVVLLHSPKKEETREEKKQRYCASAYHLREEQPNIVIYSHARQSTSMKLLNIYHWSDAMNEHYEYGKGKP